MITHRPATREDIVEYYGKVPGTVKAWVLVRDKEILAIGGVVYDKDQVRLFMEMKEEAKKYPIAIMKASYGFMKTLDKNHVLVAVADKNMESSERYLTRLGFKPYIGEVYVWQN